MKHWEYKPYLSTCLLSSPPSTINILTLYPPPPPPLKKKEFCLSMHGNMLPCNGSTGSESDWCRNHSQWDNSQGSFHHSQTQTETQSTLSLIGTILAPCRQVKIQQRSCYHLQPEPLGMYCCLLLQRKRYVKWYGMTNVYNNQYVFAHMFHLTITTVITVAYLLMSVCHENDMILPPPLH